MRWVLTGDRPQEDPAGPAAIPRLIRRLMHARGLRDAPAMQRFIEPSVDALHNPSLLPDLDRAVDRLDSALRNDEKIFLFGDYDVDGISSIALLGKYLAQFGATVRLRIPDRLTESYGLSLRAVEEAHAWGAGLILAADSGTTAVAEVEQAADQGIDVIVVDHHQPEPELPPAAALVNPWREDSRYPFRDLAAVGVVTKLLQGHWEAARKRGKEVDSPLSLLDLTALGTVADNVTMEDENRIFVFHGLGLLRGRPRPGLRALIESAGREHARITSGDIAFQLAPRINAAGRLGDPGSSLDLLLCDDPERCRSLAARLDAHNERRKQMLDSLVREAVAQAEQEAADQPGAPLVLQSEGWHIGLVGIAAARIADRFNVPAILLTSDGSTSRGSGRSAGDCDLLALVREASGSLRTFGGHRAAVGLTLDSSEFPRFRDLLLKAARHVPGLGGRREKVLPVDAVASLEEIDFSLLEWLDRLEPFGRGNQEPILALRGRVASQVRVLKNRHLKFDVTNGGVTRECIAFNLSEHARWLDRRDGEIHLAVHATRNIYRGEERLQLSVRDIAVEDPFGNS